MPALNPELIVCDAPVSALDMSIQERIISLLQWIQKASGIAYLFIAHDLRVVKRSSDRIGVMYMGQQVELATAKICTPPAPLYAGAVERGSRSGPVERPDCKDVGRHLVACDEVG